MKAGERIRPFQASNKFVGNPQKSSWRPSTILRCSVSRSVSHKLRIQSGHGNFRLRVNDDDDSVANILFLNLFSFNFHVICNNVHSNWCNQKKYVNKHKITQKKLEFRAIAVEQAIDSWGSRAGVASCDRLFWIPYKGTVHRQLQWTVRALGFLLWSVPTMGERLRKTLLWPVYV